MLKIMESEGDAKCLLVVDEKETCLAHFVPENDLEKIWNESERSRDPEEVIQVQTKDSIYEYTTHLLLQETSNRIDRPKKATEHPCFRRKILDKIQGNFRENATSHKNQEENEDFIDCEEEKIAADCKKWSIVSKASQLVDVDSIKQRGSKFVLDVLPNIVCKLYLCLGNKWTWNVMISLLEIGISVFVYLVLACATVIVTVIINYHDANFKYHKHVQFEESRIDKNQTKPNTIKEEEEELNLNDGKTESKEKV